jgi:drug/metabolite transporter (DMT)-like permease
MARQASAGIQRGLRLGVGIALLSAGAFGSSGGFAKALLLEGWSPGAVVTARIAGAALLMAIPTVVLLRGRWWLLRRNAGLVTAYGLVAVAGCQFAYFNAIEHVSIGVALLLEYLAPVLIVGYLWLRHGKRPQRLTLAGVALSLTGLLLVLDVLGGARINLVGALWGLAAAVGLVVYFLLAGHDGEEALPPMALAGAGMIVGAVVLLLGGLVGALPMDASTADVQVAGRVVPWWAPVIELALVAAAFAYATGIAAVRLLGTTLASFVALTEVLFAVLFAWLLLGELPRPVQIGGGVLIVAGVLAVRLDELRRARADAALEAVREADFRMPSEVA